MSGRRAAVLAVGAIALLLNTHAARGQGSQSSAPPVVAETAPQQNAQPSPPPERIRLSADAAARYLIHRVAPVYPQIAQVARIQGTVTLHAIIATDGRVKELQYAAGPPIFRDAAMNAVKQWKYSPFVLNGHPIEMDTSILVVFALASGTGGTNTAGEVLAKNPALARRLQLMLPDDVPVLDAAEGYKKVRDFEVALYASRDLSIPFVQFKCVELGGEYCNPPTKEKPKDAVKTIEALKPDMSKDDAKNAEKKAKEEAKALF